MARPSFITTMLHLRHWMQANDIGDPYYRGAPPRVTIELSPEDAHRALFSLQHDYGWRDWVSFGLRKAIPIAGMEVTIMPAATTYLRKGHVSADPAVLSDGWRAWADYGRRWAEMHGEIPTYRLGLTAAPLWSLSPTHGDLRGGSPPAGEDMKPGGIRWS